MTHCHVNKPFNSIQFISFPHRSIIILQIDWTKRSPLVLSHLTCKKWFPVGI